MVVAATVVACGNDGAERAQPGNSEPATAAPGGVPGDFEDGPDIVGVDNVDWWTTADGGSYRSDPKIKTAGSSSIRITSGEQGYADLTQGISAAPFAGKELTFSG